MVKFGNLTVIDQNDQALLVLDAHDLEYLLELPEHERMGHIVSLNRTVRYANRLNAFALFERLKIAADGSGTDTERSTEGGMRAPH